MFECLHRSNLCHAQGCNFIDIVETVILHCINCPIHLLYCALCKSLFNVSVLTHDCNINKSQGSILFKYYYENLPANHSIKDVVIRNYSYTETFENKGKINYAMFMSVTLFHFIPTHVLTKQILYRQ